MILNKILNYPVDAQALLRNKLKIKKMLLEQVPKKIHKNIAILGGSTTNEVADQLYLFLLSHGIEVTIYQSDYAQYWQDAMFGNPVLDTFNPDLIYIHTNWRNIIQTPMLSMSEKEIDELLLDEYSHFEQMWEALRQKFHCSIIQNNFDKPYFRLLGNRDIWDIHGRTNFLNRLNQQFYRYAQTHENFYIHDIDYLCSTMGVDHWNSPQYWHMYKYAMNLESIPVLAFSLANIIKSIYGMNKKILALDLDNTLWGGVIGDDGIEGIHLGNETPKGQLFLEFQSYLKLLKQTGTVLAVNSKNDMQNAIAGINHPDGILREDDFVCIKANWETKDKNLLEMADELSLGIDSFVFLDDNAAERDLVAANLPDVAVPNVEKPEDYILSLDRSGYFETTILSKEDMNKTMQYHAKSEAKKYETQFSNYEEFLESLKMKAIIRPFEPMYIQRIAQLTNKSNQFNLTTIRCTEDEIRAMSESSNYICLYGRLLDKFGDNGIVAISAGEIIDDTLHIRLWLMSCRVLKRSLEDAMMNTLVEKAAAAGIQKIIGYYYPTAKNSMVKDFYSTMGFTRHSEDEKGNGTFELFVADYVKRKNYCEE